MKKDGRLISATVALVTGIILTMCGHGDVHKRVVAVSIPPQQSLLREITGDSVNIVTLMRVDANPETFEVSVNDMRSVYDADVFLSTGQLPFEAAILEKIKTGAKDVVFRDVSEGIELIYGTHNHHGHIHDHSDSDVADPHIWTSLPNMKVMARNMLDAVVSIDAANAAYYTDNYNRLVSRLDSVDAAYRTALTRYRGTPFLIWHPSLSYLARDYGLEQIALGQENKDMSIRQLGDNIDKAAQREASVLFIQRNIDAAQAENIARQLDLKVVEINPMAADWENELNNIVDAIIKSDTDQGL